MTETYRDPIVHQEMHGAKNSEKLSWLRAAVLGANDGIVSVASVIVGVAGAENSPRLIVTAGIAAMVAGALSMAAGEYVSVSTQRDTERALLAKERWELENMPEAELKELADIYQKKGLTPDTATLVAKELTQHDAFAAHAEVELGIDPNNLTNPWHAAYASAAAFLVGAAIPVVAVIVLPSGYRVWGTFASVVVALAVTGTLSAYAGGAKKRRAAIRVVVGGFLAMIVTYGIGKIFGVVGI